MNLFLCILNSYHYYETHSISFTNTDEYLIIQIPIFFINNKQSPMDLYKIHTVHVPLDKDTYDRKECKYTKLDLKQNHLVISKEEYIYIPVRTSFELLS